MTSFGGRDYSKAGALARNWPKTADGDRPVLNTTQFEAEVTEAFRQHVVKYIGEMKASGGPINVVVAAALESGSKQYAKAVVEAASGVVFAAMFRVVTDVRIELNPPSSSLPGNDKQDDGN
jgi:hypothetical protein